MKLALVGVVLLTTGFAMYCAESHAGVRHIQPNPLNNNNALGVGVGVGLGGDGGSVGNTSINTVQEAADYSDLRIVPPAIAPNINTNIICPMVMQGSKAGSVFFFSGSGTHAPDIIPICVAWHLKQFEVVERMTCEKSESYRKANSNCQ
jgi:hypothetical protein